MSEQFFYDAVGLLGPALFTAAYVMTAIGKWDGTMLRLHWCNLLGAIAVLISLSHDWNLPVFVMEICWGAVAIYGIIKSFRITRAA